MFTYELFREKLAKWIAANDLPFTAVESHEFNDMMRLCHPLACAPSGDTIKKDVLDIFKTYKTKMQNLLQVSKEFNYNFIIII